MTTDSEAGSQSLSFVAALKCWHSFQNASKKLKNNYVHYKQITSVFLPHDEVYLFQPRLMVIMNRVATIIAK